MDPTTVNEYYMNEFQLDLAICHRNLFFHYTRHSYQPRINDSEYLKLFMSWLVSITLLFQPVYPTLVLPVQGLSASGWFRPSGQFQLKMSVPRFSPLTVNIAGLHLTSSYINVYIGLSNTETLNHAKSPLENVYFPLSQDSVF